MKKNYLKVFAAVLLIFVLAQSFALAGWQKTTNGYDQSAKTNQNLHLRSEPSAYSTDLGTYKIANQWVTVSGRAWDYENSIWWIRCSFSYNGKNVTGWTGAKRFVSSTYDLYGLPEYEETYYSGSNNYSSGAQEARANQSLSLRAQPNTSSKDLGTYKVSGQWITLSAKHWDNVNGIYWVKCSFNYKGSRIVGWTGAKRFDSNSYSLDALPYE